MVISNWFYMLLHNNLENEYTNRKYKSIHSVANYQTIITYSTTAHNISIMKYVRSSSSISHVYLNLRSTLLVIVIAICTGKCLLEILLEFIFINIKQLRIMSAFMIYQQKTLQCVQSNSLKIIFITIQI